MKTATIISFILVITGAVVWLLIGLFDFNIVGAIFGMASTAVVSRIIYSLVGIAGLWLILYWILYKPFKTIK